ncbi:MAG: bifunctional salicylyl-CoA 5-hydroxylase/oxidoreductase [Gemmatimonadaceae bacterium]
MKVAVIGGGPAGLYLAIQMKLADRGHEITVLERNGPDDTFGWGVVFSDQTLENFRAADSVTYGQITENFAHWDDIDIHFRDTVITSGGHGFSGIARRKLLDILQCRAAALGVELRFRCEVADGGQLAALGLGAADLIVGADGVNSLTRRRYAGHFRPDLDVRSAKFIWLGTTFKFDAFTFYFVQNDRGVYQAHCYRFDDDHSTFIVECDETSWRNAGFDRMDTAQTIGACERLFARWLDGHPLLSNAGHRRDAPWVSFTRVRNERWFHDKVVLAGDAAHTAHFSVGSGTKLAMEDAIALAGALSSEPRLAAALERYQEERKTEALRLQNAARNSMEWFENVKRYVALDPPQFAYSLLTRSQRVSHENLRLRDRRYLEGVERWFASRAAHGVGAGAPAEQREMPDVAPAIPPMFTPFRLRGMTVVNRVVVSPMDLYSATDGTPNDFHLVHLGGRALGGAGLVVTEMTCTSPEARITLGCTGMYTDDHVQGWRRITDFVHRWSPAKICLQLGHSGRKGSTKLMWEGMDEPLEDGNWEVIGPSPIPYGGGNQVPRVMTRADMTRVRDEFVRATRLAVACNFDMIELHCAHGYLLSSFITPLSNCRTDEYGGTPGNRLRYPLEVFAAMRAVWPEERPMSVRISATDWADGGIEGVDAVDMARAFAAAGADIIHVSTGQTSAESRPVYGRLFQTPFSDRIRNEAGIPTIAVGNITEADQVNGIIAAGRADLCALARPHLSDPHWTLHAAAQLGYEGQHWPVQYRTGKLQLERSLRRQAEAREAELRGIGTI